LVAVAKLDPTQVDVIGESTSVRANAAAEFAHDQRQRDQAMADHMAGLGNSFPERTAIQAATVATSSAR
jgi:hypothetical protein